ncbi:hypothetical protein Bca52824_083101 [Brassica carinata]|uniref:Uncharacterized protein n=1 Tax=Brassica carinata TaxID=52824 RepID=A0A8X7PK97_BRACI|nr:hypothetical protein Bca52824_083101 [Brassica carinata]
MGQYSYSQPSSSSEDLDISSLRAKLRLSADEAQSSFDMAEQVQYQPQPEAGDGIPTICYRGVSGVASKASNGSVLSPHEWLYKLMSRCHGRRGVVKVFWSLAKVKLSRVHLEM